MNNFILKTSFDFLFMLINSYSLMIYFSSKWNKNLQFLSPAADATSFWDESNYLTLKSKDILNVKAENIRFHDKN